MESFQFPKTKANTVTFRGVFLNGKWMNTSQMTAVTDGKDDSKCDSHPCLHGGQCQDTWGQAVTCDCEHTAYTGTDRNR